VEKQPPKWWLDIFIIDTIVRDVISENLGVISLWRVHRRATQDEIGHQLTLLCYTTDSTAKTVDELIKQHKSFKILQNKNLLREYIHEHAGSRFEETSDRNWPKELQKSWPYYIKGVSEMFLALIEQFRIQSSSTNNQTDFALIETFYIDLNKRLTLLWQQEGSHAFFHHINALFGYVPLVAKPMTISGILASF
jgi:hypothetical protein